MAQQQYPVEVQSDFLEKITRAKPVQALAELIWNGLDADAARVSVSFGYNEMETAPRRFVWNLAGTRHGSSLHRRMVQPS